MHVYYPINVASIGVWAQRSSKIIPCRDLCQWINICLVAFRFIDMGKGVKNIKNPSTIQSTPNFSANFVIASRIKWIDLQ